MSLKLHQTTPWLSVKLCHKEQSEGSLTQALILGEISFMVAPLGIWTTSLHKTRFVRKRLRLYVSQSSDSCCVHPFQTVEYMRKQEKKIEFEI